MNHSKTEGPAEQTIGELVGAGCGGLQLTPDISRGLVALLSRTPTELSLKELAHAIAGGLYLPPLVRRLLDRVGADPLASAGWFPGDLFRSLMDVPGWFWRREGELHDRYRETLRAAALARRDLPADQRREFWNPIPKIES